MTALHQYQRLEAAGLWRENHAAQRREVIVGLRDATIILMDPKTEMPLTQWSLPAITRLQEINGFVTYASASDGIETLEIDDTAMIAAFDKLRNVIDRRRRRPGRLRSALILGAATTVIIATAIWMPLRLTSFTAERLPQAARAQIGALALADIQKTTGSACNTRIGQIASENLARRLDPTRPPQILVMRAGLPRPMALPGGMILLPYDMIAAAEGPDYLAALILAEMVRATTHDPTMTILQHAGFLASFRLLSSGNLPAGALDGYGLSVANKAPAPVDLQQLQIAFQDAKITALPYLEASAVEFGLTDPMPNGSDPIVLDDADFLALQYICGT